MKGKQHMSFNEYDLLNDKEQSEFANVVNALLFQNYVVERVFNSSKGKFETNSDYRFIEYNHAVVRDYLKMIGWELIMDDMNGVISVKNDNFSNSINLNKTTTLFLLILRLIYEEKQSKASLSKDINVKLSEILYKLEVFKVFEKKNPPEYEIIPALKLLKKYQILEKKAGEYAHPDTIFIIYPSITHALKSENLLELIKRFDVVNKNKNDKLSNEQDDSAIEPINLLEDIHEEEIDNEGDY